jgi:sarcosine oxidase/L-pipecolate oxidase
MSAVMADLPKEGEPVTGTYDAIVIGAGIVGSCTAYQLAKRGKSVLLLEQFDFLHHRGSSHGESRTIRVTYPELYYTQMMKEAYKLWEEAETEAGYMVYQRTGQLDFGPPSSTSIASVITNLSTENIEHEVLTHSQCKARFPSLHLPEDSIILYTKQGGILRASKAVALFQSLALRHGATLRDRAKLVQISNHWKLPDGSNGVLVATNRDYGDPYIYGTPSIEYPGLIKVSVHSGSSCDPNNRSVAPDYEHLKKEVFQGMGLKWDLLLVALWPIWLFMELLQVCHWSFSRSLGF